MQGWKTAGWSAVCGLGVLSFLGLVACEIERTDRALARRREQAAKAYDRHHGDAASAESPPSRRAGAASQRNGRKRDFVARSQR